MNMRNHEYVYVGIHYRYMLNARDTYTKSLTIRIFEPESFKIAASYACMCVYVYVRITNLRCTPIERVEALPA